MANLPELEPGTLVDNRYQIIESIGQGGMATVYRAHQATLDRDVALKVIHRHLIEEEEFLQRFRQEAQNLATLRHGNVLQVYDFSADPTLCYMVTEYLPGDTLGLRLFRYGRRGVTMPLIELYATIQDVCSGLSYAHGRGLIHRDIKPTNVMYDGGGAAVLTDFGISRLASRDLKLTAPDSIIGTPSYVAPDYIRGERGDARADIYSIGVMMFEMATGRLPFEATNPFAMAQHHLNTPAPAPSTFRSDLPASLDTIVLQALAKKPADRYQSITALQADLAAIEFGSAVVSIATRAADPRADETVVLDPPSSELPPPPNNLSSPITSFVGRSEQVAALQKMMMADESRLITLVGPGGVGKTRLSQQVAAQSLFAFPDGVFFIELAAVTTTERVLSAIEQALAVPVAVGDDRPVLQRIRDFLHAKRILIVLDNLEQVTIAAADIAEIATASNDLRVLVTSREVLHVYGEREFTVNPFDIPLEILDGEATEWETVPALLLFAERARAARPNFELTAENAPIVAEICAYLDGLPLAIELAAARVKLLGPRAILGRLINDGGTTSSLKLLRGGMRNRPVRQQTLRGAIDWSYDLLEEDEQRLFTRLAAFVGPRTVEAVEAICSLDGDLELDPLDGLASLVDKSLLQQREGPDGEPTFLMLTTIHEYARTRLEQQADARSIRAQHAAYFLNLVEEAEPHFMGAGQKHWLDQLELQHDNLRTAVEWSLSQQEIEACCRHAAALWRFWHIRGYAREGRRLIERIQAAAEGAVTERVAYARMLAAAGHLAYLHSDFGSAKPLYELAQTRFQQLGETGQGGLLLHNLGLLAFKQGQYEEALALYEQSMAQLKSVDDRTGAASVLNSLGNLAWLRKEFPAARQYYGESMAYWRQLGNKQNTAMVANNLGAIAMSTGDYAAAEKIFDECLLIQRELNNPNGVALALSNLSEVAIEQGSYAPARRFLLEALAIQRDLERKERIAILLEGFGRLEARTNEPRRAAFLFGAAETLREQIKAPRPAIVQAQFEPDWERVRTELGQVAFAAAWAQGRHLTMEEAIDFARNESNGSAGGPEILM